MDLKSKIFCALIHRLELILVSNVYPEIIHLSDDKELTVKELL